MISDYDVREGVKDYSSWPTLPQIYIDGEFMGGSDILTQMHESGELKEVIASAAARLDKEHAGYLGEAADKYEQLRPLLVRSSR